MKQIMILFLTVLLLCLPALCALGEPIIWDNGQYGSIYSVLKLPNNEADVCMNTMRKEDGTKMSRLFGHGLLTKVGANGETIWSLRYQSEDYATNIFCDAIALQDGSIVADLHQYGNGSENAGQDKDRYLLVHVSKDGEILNEYPIECDIMYCAQDGFFAMDYDHEVGVETRRFTLYNEKGEAVWTKDLPRGIFNHRSSTVSIEDGYLIPGSASTRDAGMEDYAITKLDKSAEIIWESKPGSSLKPDQHRSVGAIVALEDGSVIGIGTDWTSVGEFNTPSYAITQMNRLMVKLDKDGKLLWEKSFPVEERYSKLIMDVLKLDKGILIAGTARTDTQATYQLFDFEGNLVSSWTDVKRNDISMIHTIYLMQLGDEAWAALTIGLDDLNHIELSRITLPN